MKFYHEIDLSESYRESFQSSFSVEKEEVELREQYMEELGQDLEKFNLKCPTLKSNPRKSKWARAISHLNINMVDGRVLTK